MCVLISKCSPNGKSLYSRDRQWGDKEEKKVRTEDGGLVVGYGWASIKLACSVSGHREDK